MNDEFFKEVLKKEEFFKEMLNTVSDGIYLLNRKRKIIFWSRGRNC